MLLIISDWEMFCVRARCALSFVTVVNFVVFVCIWIESIFGWQSKLKFILRFFSSPLRSQLTKSSTTIHRNEHFIIRNSSCCGISGRSESRTHSFRFVQNDYFRISRNENDVVLKSHVSCLISFMYEHFVLPMIFFSPTASVA